MTLFVNAEYLAALQSPAYNRQALHTAQPF